MFTPCCSQKGRGRRKKGGVTLGRGERANFTIHNVFLRKGGKGEKKVFTFTRRGGKRGERGKRGGGKKKSVFLVQRPKKRKEEDKLPPLEKNKGKGTKKRGGDEDVKVETKGKKLFRTVSAGKYNKKKK